MSDNQVVSLLLFFCTIVFLVCLVLIIKNVRERKKRFEEEYDFLEDHTETEENDDKVRSLPDEKETVSFLKREDDSEKYRKCPYCGTENLKDMTSCIVCMGQF